MSTLKVSNIQDISNNAAMSISGGVTTFNNLPVNASAAGSAAFLARFTPATGASWATVANGGIIPFNDASTQDAFDTDSVFNTSTYKFTAPATGVYMFWYGIYTANSDSQNGFCFIKNDLKFRTQAATDELLTFVAVESGDHIQNGTIIAPLSSGDTIAVGGSTASDYYTGHCQWGGCRLA